MDSDSSDDDHHRAMLLAGCRGHRQRLQAMAGRGAAHVGSMALSIYLTPQ